ncbi:uncharacterized protein LOC110980820 [Acanthaster planci]|uniref:Uncharacterized protein LOC110980820 n=1 Tax=Acanthaster planci TaxID=133434 RepID=A0A8B7YLK0_ACAPL|nr:uncharacterized protein LOC110980820 [Acanthaster planci]
MAAGGPASAARGPPPGLAFNLDEWVPCVAYLGHTDQRETNTVTNADLARVVAKLYGRHELDHGAIMGQMPTTTEVYVKVVPPGLILRVINTSLSHRASDGPREGIREFFETVRIARCSANHEPCTHALVWVYNRRPSLGGTVDGLVECHGVVCRDLRDATRLANTLAMAFYEMRQQSVAIGNAFGAVGGAVSMSGLMWSMPGELPPAYTPVTGDGAPEPRAMRGRSRGSRQMRVLEVATVHREDDCDEDSGLDPSPRSTGSPSSREATPRNATGGMRNSTVSLHSTVAISEGRSPRGRRPGGLPDVSADDSWGSRVE